MAAAKKKTKESFSVSYKALVAALGKTTDDPAVKAVIAKAGKVVVRPDFIIAKQAGFDFGLGQPTGAKPNARKQVMTVFLYPEGKDGHSGFADLPKGYTFSTRAEVLAALGQPVGSWKIGKGAVAVDTAGVSHDEWALDGNKMVVSYAQSGEVRIVIVSLPEEEVGGRDLSTSPLHFATKPSDAPLNAGLTGMGFLVAWAATRFGLPKKHASSEHGKALLARTLTPRAFLMAACNKQLSSLDVDAKPVDFLWGYTHRLLLQGKDGSRAKAEAKIVELLSLEEERAYFVDDYLATFSAVVENPFHVPDSWGAFERIAPVIDARWADFQETKFRTAPTLAPYQKAAKLRDAQSVTPDVATVAKVEVADDAAAALVALIGQSLTDKAVKATLTKLALPIGKRIDEQANAAIGVSYMGSKFLIDEKQTLGVFSVGFYAAKQKSYIRGIGAEVEFKAFTGSLPRGLAFGQSMKAAKAAVGVAPAREDEDSLYFKLSSALSLNCDFENEKLVHVSFFKPKS